MSSSSFSACGKRVKHVTSTGRGCYVYEPVEEPSGQILTKIWALKAWLNKPIKQQIDHVQVFKPLQMHRCMKTRHRETIIPAGCGRRGTLHNPSTRYVAAQLDKHIYFVYCLLQCHLIDLHLSTPTFWRFILDSAAFAPSVIAATCCMQQLHEKSRLK